jgi:hypothetical protein
MPNMLLKEFSMARRTLTFSIFAFCAACAGGIVGSATVNGTYTLRTINGAALPYSTTTGGVTTEVIDDAITLYAGSTYSELGHSRTTTNGQVTNNTNTETENYTLLGNSVTLHAVAQSGKESRSSRQIQ